MEVQQKSKKGIIGNFSHCVISINNVKNVDITNREFSFFPSEKVKYGVFFTELFIQLLSLFNFLN